jgi:anti-anti-sigma factor
MRLADVRLSVEGAVVTARLTGDVDLSNAGTIRSQITGAMPNEAKALVVDLTAVGYLDSAGIHFVHRLRDDLLARGQRLMLVVAPNSIVADTLRLAGVRWDDDVADTVAQAQERLGVGSDSPAVADRSDAPTSGQR